LFITEVMSLACTNRGYPRGRDWWELTNLGFFPVNLRGWRWDDEGKLGGGPTIGLKESVTTNCGCVPVLKKEWYNVIVQPGESIIFVEGVSAEEFIAWWGASYLPPNLQIITYYANGLDDRGDLIRLWTSAATNPDDYVCDQAFSTASAGLSWWFIPDPTPCGEFGNLSTNGAYGAFQAATDCDVGSPGWTPWSPPYFTWAGWQGTNLVLNWRAAPGVTNMVQCRTNLSNRDWITLGKHCSANALRTAIVSTAVASASTQCVFRFTCQPWPPLACEYGTDYFGSPLGGVAVQPVTAGLLRPANGLLPGMALAFSTWGAQANKGYYVRYRNNVHSGLWSQASLDSATAAFLLIDYNVLAKPNRFYQALPIP
jgi:hypothetical protein